MVRVLVAHTERSKSELTFAAEIAVGIHEELGSRASISIVSADDEPRIDRFDAYVIGSALEHGRWMRAAQKFAIRNRFALSHRPIALYATVGPASDAHTLMMVRQAVARGRLDRLINYQPPIRISTTDLLGSALIGAESILDHGALSMLASRLFRAKEVEDQQLESCHAFGRQIGARIYSDCLAPPFRLEDVA